MKSSVVAPFIVAVGVAAVGGLAVPFGTQKPEPVVLALADELVARNGERELAEAAVTVRPSTALPDSRKRCREAWVQYTWENPRLQLSEVYHECEESEREAFEKLLPYDGRAVMVPLKRSAAPKTA